MKNYDDYDDDMSNFDSDDSFEDIDAEKEDDEIDATEGKQPVTARRKGKRKANRSPTASDNNDVSARPRKRPRGNRSLNRPPRKVSRGHNRGDPELGINPVEGIDEDDFDPDLVCQGLISNRDAIEKAHDRSHRALHLGVQEVFEVVAAFEGREEDQKRLMAVAKTKHKITGRGDGAFDRVVAQLGAHREAKYASRCVLAGRYVRSEGYGVEELADGMKAKGGMERCARKGIPRKADPDKKDPPEPSFKIEFADKVSRALDNAKPGRSFTAQGRATQNGAKLTSITWRRA